MNNLKTVVTFFEAYQRHDADGMFKCLDPDIEFSDLAFERIQGDDVRMMWRWFCKKPVEVPTFQTVLSDGERVRVHYRVKYSVEGGGIVDYVIQADLVLREGRIFRQVDSPTISNFTFAKMAMGFPKCLLALTPLFKPLVRRRMRKSLDDFGTMQQRSSTGYQADSKQLAER